MKELSIEEKAKAYDEAIEKAKIWQEHLYDVNDKDYADELNYIFSELKESEDERIRKELICFLETEIPQCNARDKYIAWLEKQGETSSIHSNSSNIGKVTLSEEEQNRFAKGVLSSCALSFIDYLDAHKYEGKMCVSNGECEDIENAFHNAMWDRLHRYYCKYIEKQSEQKPNYCHHEVDLSECSEEYRKAYYDGWNNCNMQHSQCKSELDDVVKCLINGMKFYYEDNEEATWGTDKWSMPVKHIIEVLEKQGEQKPQRMISAEAKEAMYDKSAWSEDDKDVINHLIDICKSAKKFIQFASCTQDDITKCQDWLTSLKERI